MGNGQRERKLMQNGDSTVVAIPPMLLELMNLEQGMHVSWDFDQEAEALVVTRAD